MKKGSYKLLCRLLCAGLFLSLALPHPAAVSAAASAVGDHLFASGSKDAAAEQNTSSGTIRIGNVSFHPEDDVSSHWSEGKGWKNLPGQYVALVDYNGTGTEISMDSGTLTLGVAGVNRIGTLKGDCSVRIVGTGIVLIDSIEIEEGNGLFLHSNTALYEEGSAAVFLQQNDGSYLLINGGIPGILDEDYAVDGVRLTVPEGSSLVFSSWGIRTETWFPYDAEEPATDVRWYKNTIPPEDLNPFHENSLLELNTTAARLTLGKNSKLTVESNASLRLEQVRCEAPGLNVSGAASNLVVKGTVEVRGLVEGGLLDIHDGGSLVGSGTVRSSQVELAAGGDLSKDLLLEKGGVAVKGSDRTISLRIKDAAVYLKSPRILLKELKVEGTNSWLGVETDEELGNMYSRSEVGNITFSSGGNLAIVCNDHSYVPYSGHSARYVEDCFLTISGRISGGTVSVLAGCVHYTGTENDVLPAVPSGFAARVYVTGTEMASALSPVNMTDEEAAVLAAKDTIPVSRLFVWDSLIVSGDGATTYALARKWEIQSTQGLDPLVRTDDQTFTCASFLEAYNLQGDSSESTHWTAVEVIYSDLSRVRYFIEENFEFSTDNAILIRVLDCMGMGGQGGSAISHNETSFSGSGSLGKTGSGSVTYGNGKVVFPPNFDPSPTEPETSSDEPGTSSGQSETETSQTVTETASHEPETSSESEETVPETGETETSSSQSETESESESQETVPESGETESESGQTEPETETGEPDTTSSRSETESHETETESESQETVPESGETESESGESETESSHPETEPESGETETESESQETVPESDETESESGETETSSSQAETESESQETEPETEEPETRVYGDLTVEVTPLGNGQYSLAVYRNDVPLDSLNGLSVTAAIRDPQGVTEGDLCYAVFEEDRQSGWIPADYDPFTRELTFNTDRIGTFRLVRLRVEEVRFRTAATDAPLYRKLTVRSGGDELAGLPGPFMIDLSLTPSESGGAGLYAVFVNEDEDLSIFPLTFDSDTQKYRFETDVTGDFVLVQPVNAALSGSELYDACMASDEVRILITVLRLYAFWY